MWVYSLKYSVIVSSDKSIIKVNVDVWMLQYKYYLDWIFS
jgi:hypothetical protein